MIKDKVLAMEWIPVCQSLKVTKDTPIQVQILGEKVVLFRTNSGVSAFMDLCIHRGASLSLGKIKNDCIICPYHGWEYNEDGACVKIPQLPEKQAIPLKAHATTYSCMEMYDLIWVNMGNNLPAEPFFEELHDAAFQSILFGPNEMMASAPRILENSLDVSHFAFAHDGYLGDSRYPQISDYKVHKIGDKLVTDEIMVYQPNADTIGEVVNYLTLELANPLTKISRKIDKKSGNKVFIVTTVLPVDDRKSIIFQIFAFNHHFEIDRDTFFDYQKIILAQDQAILENQRPEELPLDLQAELHLKPDLMSIAYRKYLNELGVKLGTS